MSETQAMNLILPDQLFDDHPCFKLSGDFVMIESYEEATRLKFHKYKLAFIFSTMREYAFRHQKKDIKYFKIDKNTNYEYIISTLVEQKKYKTIQTAKINDKYLRHNLLEICKKNGLELKEYDSEMFLFTSLEFQNYLKNKTTKGLLLNNFYVYARKKLNILIHKGKPVGGRWSFDDQNRKKYPKNIQIPKRDECFESVFYSEVCISIEELFPNNPGILPKYSHFALNSVDALKCLDFFLTHCLNDFGNYQDAMTSNTNFGFHSVISPYLNNGLLTPRQVLNRLFDNKNIPIVENINSIEGFVRQLIGWREWVKGLYDHVYQENLCQYNFWNHTTSLPHYFYNPESPGSPESTELLHDNEPLKDALSKAHKLAYNHHIERLMIISNWCLLNEYAPKEVFNWFVEMYVDSADWVMVANVLGMGIFADGGIFATKPYLSGGNYIKKMSDYPNSKKWEPVWTEKFWNFLSKNKEYFKTNPRMNMLLSLQEKKDSDKNATTFSDSDRNACNLSGSDR
ncbi:MAG: cryptochrome/photolyase family protein [Candidatus Paceibacterota bacterium]